MIDRTERAATRPSPLALPVSPQNSSAPQTPQTPTFARLVDRLSRPTISSLGGGGSSTSGSVTGSPESQLQNAASRAPTLKADVARDLSAILNRLPESPMLNKHKLRTRGPEAHTQCLHTCAFAPCASMHALTNEWRERPRGSHTMLAYMCIRPLCSHACIN